MKNGIWQIDGDRKVQLSANPAALNTRDIARAFRQSLADVQASTEEAQSITAWFAWSRDLMMYAGTDAAAIDVLTAVMVGAETYVSLGAPRPVQPHDTPDTGEQTAF